MPCAQGLPEARTLQQACNCLEATRLYSAAMLCRPECEGDAPSTRFRHTTAPINPSPGTPLHDLVSEALGGKQPMSSGQLLLVFGGYNTIGEEFGANSTFVSC